MAKRPLKILDLSALDIDGNDVVVTPDDLAEQFSYTPPSSLTLSVCDVRCKSCGTIHRENLGIFTETIRGGTRTLTRVKSKEELKSLSYLPRRVDYAPLSEIAICSCCWLIDEFFDNLTKPEPETLNPEVLP